MISFRFKIVWCNLPATILPSPDPKSTTAPFRSFKAVRILRICKFVAGINGKQCLRSAGVTNGTQITVKPTATVPEI